MQKSSIFYLFFTFWLIFLIIATAGIYQLPNKTFRMHYFNNNSRTSQQFESYIDGVEEVGLRVWTHLIIDLGEEEVILTIRLDFRGLISNLTQLPYFVDNASISFGNNEMLLTTRSFARPNASVLLLNSGTLDRMNFKVPFNQSLFAKRSAIDVRINVGLYDYYNLSQSEPVDQITDFGQFKYYKEFILFNKSSFTAIIIATWLITLIFLKEVLYGKFDLDHDSSYERLLFIVILFPNLMATFFAIIFTPFVYQTSYGIRNNAQLLTTKELFLSSIINIIFVLTFYLIVPFLIDFFKKWVSSRNLNESLRIHTSFLKSLNVPKHVSTNNFFKRIKGRIFVFSLIAGPVFQVVNITIIFLVTEATSLSFLFVPVYYIYWKFSRDPLLEGYIIKS